MIQGYVLGSGRVFFTVHSKLQQGSNFPRHQGHTSFLVILGREAENSNLFRGEGSGSKRLQKVFHALQDSRAERNPGRLIDTMMIRTREKDIS